MALPIKLCVLRQYIIVIVANFTYLCFGLQIGWPSPVIAKLKHVNQTVLPEPISDDAAAWVVSCGVLAGTAMTLFTGYLMDQLGRKVTLVLVSVPRLVSCLLTIFASQVWMLLLARSLSGMADAYGICVLFTYTSEIASKEIRGALGTIAQMSFAIGSMIMLTIGPFLSYLQLNIMVTVIVVVLCVPTLFLPETPYFLFSQGRREDCIAVLTHLRGSKEAALDELKDYSTTTPSVNKLMIFKSKTVWKTLGKSLFLINGAQFTGYNAVSFYLQSVFASTHTSVTPEISSLVIGFIELLACFCTIFLTDRCGRKPVLTVSLGVMSIGMIGLGTFFYYKDNNYEITGFLNFLPLLSVMLAIFCYNAGIGCIMMMYIAELFDGTSRAIGISTCVTVASVFTFLVIRFFASVTLSIGPMSTYYGFSVGCVILCLFVLMCLPETKGKAFSEIQKEIDGGNGKQCNETS